MPVYGDVYMMFLIVIKFVSWSFSPVSSTNKTEVPLTTNNPHPCLRKEKESN